MAVYTYEEAFEESVKYFDGDELAAKVFLDKYSLRNNELELLEKTPDDMHRRIAKEFARIEKNKFKKPLSEDEIYEYFKGFNRLIAQGSPMFGIGNPYQTISLSNCFVIPSPVDSYGGICKADEELVQISKRRGGVGLDISNIRPAGSSTRNSSRTSTGIIPFMERFSNSIREVGQSGRRGALMITISIHHPEILEFIKVKLDRTKVTGANISTRLSKEFLKAVKNNIDYELRFPVDSKKPTFSKMVSARKIWNELIKCAHEMAEPGLIFWDNVIENSPADCYSDLGFETICTNPCSELPLSESDSCRLLLLNLYTYVKNPFTKEAVFDYEYFYKDSQIAQRMMDNLVDLELECINKIISKIKSDSESDEIKDRELTLWKNIKKACENGRRTGTGITALGDTIASLGLKYGSDESIKVTKKIYKTLKLGCYRSSVDMAKELGAFPIFDWKRERHNPFLLRIKGEDIELWNDMRKYGRRNIALLTTAPAGSVSLLSRTSSGIEPVFMLSYTRRKKINPNDKNSRVDFKDQNGDSWQEFLVYHPKVKIWTDITGEKNIEKSPWYGCCAEDLNWKKRVELQAKAQLHVDHSLSSTINLPEDVTVEKVSEIYQTAYDCGVKGLTIYRKGSRTGVLVETQKKQIEQQHNKRPKDLNCDIHFFKVKNKEFFVIVGFVEDKPYEVFAGENGHLPKDVEHGIITKIKRGHYKITTDKGECFIQDTIKKLDENEGAITRLVSTSLRHEIPVHFIVDQLEKVDGDFQSFSKCIARALKKYIANNTKVHGQTCGSCQSENLVRNSGCLTCSNCGWSKCS